MSRIMVRGTGLVLTAWVHPPGEKNAGRKAAWQDRPGPGPGPGSIPAVATAAAAYAVRYGLVDSALPASVASAH
jgi:hypothetical protein